ncbi:hypothetical protein ES703_68559 [subsurface metagenome]
MVNVLNIRLLWTNKRIIYPLTFATYQYNAMRLSPPAKIAGELKKNSCINRLLSFGKCIVFISILKAVKEIPNTIEAIKCP